MQDVIDCEIEVTKIQLNAIAGDPEAVNELLGFIIDRVDSTTGLNKIVFQGWRKTLEDVESEVLTLLATKTSNL